MTVSTMHSTARYGRDGVIGRACFVFLFIFLVLPILPFKLRANDVSRICIEPCIICVLLI